MKCMGGIMMSDEKIAFDIDQKLVVNGQLYLKDQLPPQMSFAIYAYGSPDILDVVAFIDASQEQDGSQGMIITPQAFYFQLGQTGHINFEDITSLQLEKHHQNPSVKAIVKTAQGGFAFRRQTIDPEVFLDILSQVTGLHIDLKMTVHEKVAYYISIVLNDLAGDVYEDLELNQEEKKFMKELTQELQIIEGLDEENYCYELEHLCSRAWEFFDELGLDSEEVDELYKIHEEFERLHQIDDQKINDAQAFYDEMVNQYQQGNTQMYDQVKDAMAQLGIDERELAGKSMEDIKDYFCHRLGISRNVMDHLVQKMTHKN